MAPLLDDRASRQVSEKGAATSSQPGVSSGLQFLFFFFLCVTAGVALLV